MSPSRRQIFERRWRQRRRGKNGLWLKATTLGWSLFLVPTSSQVSTPSALKSIQDRHRHALGPTALVGGVEEHDFLERRRGQA